LVTRRAAVLGDTCDHHLATRSGLVATLAARIYRVTTLVVRPHAAQRAPPRYDAGKRSPDHVAAIGAAVHVTLLEQVFLLEELPPWHSNRLSRLVKTPKLHLGDTGVAGSVLGLDAGALHEDRGVLGQLLETFVYQELRRQASGQEDEIRFHHFRDKAGYEVDVVLERAGRQVAGVEVKAAATVTAADFRGLRKLASAVGRRFAAGVVSYDGETSASFGDQLHAVPIRALWET